MPAVWESGHRCLTSIADNDAKRDEFASGDNSWLSSDSSREKLCQRDTHTFKQDVVSHGNVPLGRTALLRFGPLLCATRACCMAPSQDLSEDKVNSASWWMQVFRNDSATELLLKIFQSTIAIDAIHSKVDLSSSKSFQEKSISPLPSSAWLRPLRISLFWKSLPGAPWRFACRATAARPAEREHCCSSGWRLLEKKNSEHRPSQNLKFFKWRTNSDGVSYVICVRNLMYKSMIRTNK